MYFRPALACVFLTLCTVGWSQSTPPAADSEAAPPEIDKALRERVNFFYQAHVDGKFRLADQVVDEDSKDYFFAMPKPRFRKCDIRLIRYTDNFTKATVTTACDSDFIFRGQRVPVVAPVTTTWKIDGGQWFWYHEQAKDIKTPFGIMHPGPDSTAAAGPPGFPGDLNAAARQILEAVKTDRSEVHFSSSQLSKQEVRVINSMPGEVSLSIDTSAVPGLKAHFDKRELGAKQTAVLTLTFDPKVSGAERVSAPLAADLHILVQPIGKDLPLHVTFAKDRASQ